MSHEPSPRERSTEPAASREIEQLIDGLARLAGSDIEPRRFHQRALESAVKGLAAAGGAIWARSADGQIRSECQFRMEAIPLAETWADAQRHTQLLVATIGASEPRLVAPRAALAGEPQAANPTDYLIVLAPLVVVGAAGLIEIFQRPGISPTTQQGNVRFMAAVGEIAADYQRHRELHELRDRGALWRQFDQFAGQVHASLDLRTVAYTIANDGRDLIGCDRLSVAIIRGRSCRMLAVSGIDKLDRRAEVVRRLERLATAVVVTGEPFWYVDGDAQVPPQIEGPVEQALDETHARSVAVLPVSPASENDDQGGERPESREEHSRR